MKRDKCPACDSSMLRLSSAGGGQFLGHSYAYLKCRSCGTVFVSPAPPPEVIAKMYGPEYVQAHYADDGSSVASPEFDGAAKLIATRKPGGRVLDLGCGSGAFVNALGSAGLRVEGFELNAATAREAACSTGRLVHSGSLQTLEGRYDAIHAADVLEHLADPLAVVVSLRALLEPEGILLLRGPLEGNANLFDLLMRTRRRALHILRPAKAELPPWHLILFSVSGWRALIGRAGFICVEERVSETDWPSAQSGVKRMVRSASLALSNGMAGRRLSWGNRVVSVWRRSA